MTDQGSKELRELIRLLVRNLGVLEKGDAICCGITIAQCHAVVEIGRAGSISLTDLADMLGLDKSTMSRTIDNLVGIGAALREVDEKNRRYVTIRLTEAGNALFENIETSNESYYGCIFADIPEGKRAQVLESLQLLSQAVKRNKCC
jgi:DNA-binding MarR family transcriptional regulator